jgi:hypothetical protein
VGWDRNGYQYRDSKDDFAVTVNGHSVGVALRQKIDRTRHVPTLAEEAKVTSTSWYRIPKFDLAPSDRLSVHLSGPFKHRQSAWTDSSTTRLEDSLPQILQEIELRAEAAEQRRMAAVVEAERRQGQWERAMDHARVKYGEAFRAKALLRQSEDWHLVRQVRSYLVAMQAVIETTADPEEVLAAREWHAWADRWVGGVDPLGRPPALPRVPEPKPDDLEPFLDGWNPYGPDRSRR